MRSCGECRARCVRPACHYPPNPCGHHYLKGKCDPNMCRGAHDHVMSSADFNLKFCRAFLKRSCKALKCDVPHLTFNQLVRASCFGKSLFIGIMVA